MGREQMRNLETSKIGATQVNEVEFHKNKGEMTEQHESHSGLIPGSAPQTKAERVAQIMADAHRKVEKKRKKRKTAESSSKQAAGAAMRAPAAQSKPKSAGKKNAAGETGAAKQSRKKAQKK